MTLNRIVTPLIRIQNTPTSEPPQVTSNLKIMTSLLIQECATEIFILAYNESELIHLKSEISSLPPSLKNRVKIEDENGTLQEKIRNYLEPIQKINIKSNAVYTNPYLETALRVLGVASEKQCQADIPGIDNIINHLKWSKHNCIDEEGRGRVDNLIGLFNSYEKESISGFNLKSTSSSFPTVSERLDDLLNQDNLEELSTIRQSLGSSDQLKNIKIIEKELVKKNNNFLKNSTYNEILDITPIWATLATKKENDITIPNSLSNWKKYSPPIFDLIEIRKKLLKHLPDLGNFIFLLADAPLPSKVGEPNTSPGEMFFPGVFSAEGSEISFSFKPKNN